MNSIPSIDSYLTSLPEALRNPVKRDWLKLGERCRQLGLTVAEDRKILKSIPVVWGASQFVANYCVNNIHVLNSLVDSGDLESAFDCTVYSSLLGEFKFDNIDDLNRKLRRFRNYQMVRIAWRDIADWSSLGQTLLELSWLAEACLKTALDFHYDQACQKYGVPLLMNGKPQQLIVLGMGKLGAWELNFSSDIDLIFAYPEDGELEGKSVSTYSEFFTRLCRNLIRTIDLVIEEGFVFRVDLRLRPFGESGPLVMSFAAIEQYYQSQARDWERYAMIKARVVAGDFVAGSELEQILHPFIYRRYLDYGAFSELRRLKSKITQELKRKDRLENIKLGPGGIREIEFIGQAFQLIRGGREVALQDRRILRVLEEIENYSLLPSTIVAKLKTAYIFLRTVENRLQEYGDKQVHELPVCPEQRIRLIHSLGFDSWDTFKVEIDKIRDQVQEVFEQVFESPQATNNHGQADKVWVSRAIDQEVIEAMEMLGFTEYEDTMATIESFRTATPIVKLATKAKCDLDSLMPMLLGAVGVVDSPEKTLKRILRLLEAVASRSVYLTLLVENPLALSQLVKLAASSTWIVTYISRYPLLFDELLDARSLYAPRSKQALIIELKQRIGKLGIENLERLMAEMRHFKQANVLRVAAADIMGVVSVGAVSDYLTDIAEVTLSQALDTAWELVAKRYGVPPGATANKPAGFAIVGYGKLGGIELGYASDLDLVFLFGGTGSGEFTDGSRPISCAQFYIRLGQKIINLLDTNMLAGVLYEVDMRLRPSGNSGLLVSQIEAFDLYQHNDAWTWEHQALVRARFITGDVVVGQRFNEIRASILTQGRDEEQLRQDVYQMREKMRASLVPNDLAKFDLKQGVGGIADIEFIVQFATLLCAGDNPVLVGYSDTVRLLETLVLIGFLGEQDSETLKTAYFEYRDCVHRFALQEKSAVVSSDKFKTLRIQVEEIWLRLMH